MRRARAYFVLAHHKPQQLRWLIEALVHGDPGRADLILLHVDRKSMLGLKADRKGIWPMAKALAAEYPAVRLMRPRFTNWGGWSLSQIHLDAIDQALDASDRWSHFVNLSGQCYPIKPAAEIHAALDAAEDQAFVELRPFDTLPEDDWHLRRFPMIELPHKAYKLRGPRKLPDSFEFAFKGAQWSILPRAFCEWQRAAPVGAEIRRYLRGLLLSDELIIQTLIRNGPWRDRLAPHLGHAIVWPGPKVWSMDDRDELAAHPAFYARKFDHARDPELLPHLSSTLGYPRTGSTLMPRAA